MTPKTLIISVLAGVVFGVTPVAGYFVFMRTSAPKIETRNVERFDVASETISLKWPLAERHTGLAGVSFKVDEHGVATRTLAAGEQAVAKFLETSGEIGAKCLQSIFVVIMNPSAASHDRPMLAGLPRTTPQDAPLVPAGARFVLEGNDTVPPAICGNKAENSAAAARCTAYLRTHVPMTAYYVYDPQACGYDHVVVSQSILEYVSVLNRQAGR
jgi:hypothetical protein